MMLKCYRQMVSSTKLHRGPIVAPQKCSVDFRIPIRHFSGRDNGQIIHTSPYGSVNIPEITVWEDIQRTALNNPSKTALICGLSHSKMSFLELLQQVQKVATSLKNIGVKKGTVVISNTINCVEYPIMFYALTALGAIFSPASPMFNAKELASQIQASGATFMITNDAVSKAAQEAAVECGMKNENIFCIGGKTANLKSFRSLQDVSGIEWKTFTQTKVNLRKDINMIPFSSGTTGPPKGVMLSFYNIISNLHQTSPVENFSEPSLLVLPLYHIYASVLMNLALHQGKGLVILPRFDPEAFLNCMQKYEIEKVHIAPPIAGFLAKHPLVEKFDLSRTKFLISAAAPLGSGLEELIKKKLNITLKQAYGMTELSPVVNYAHDSDIKPGSIGWVVPNTELRIVCPETKADVPINTKGELLYRGPQNMLGYLNNEKATKETITPDNFLKTGDIGYIDEDRHVYIVDRLKELIKYKGYQIAPAELEDVVLKHPNVLDVACIRGFDGEGNEIPKACVVLKPETKLSEQELMDFVAEHVAPYKKIRKVEFVSMIPKSASGKILRRELQVLEKKTS